MNCFLKGLNSPFEKRKHLLANVTMNLKISEIMPTDVSRKCRGELLSICPQPSAKCYTYICESEPARYWSKPTASHKMKTIQSLVLVATVALLFLVGEYAATYTRLADTFLGRLASALS
jgi:hypothetical protein